MNSKRVYFILLGSIGLLFVGLIGSTYGIDQVLQHKSKQLVDLKLQSQVLGNQKIGLTKAKKEVQTYSELNTVAKTIVPQDKDQAEAVREISNLAVQSGIGQLSSVTFPLSTLGGTIGVTTTPGSTSPNSKNNLTQLTPVKGVTGLYQLQITIQQAGDSPVSYDKFLNFLGSLEQNRRTAQVSSINLTPDSKKPSLVGFTLVINEFIRP